MSLKKKIYAKDGVDVDEEAKFSSFAGKICKQSYKNNKFVEVKDLSGGHFRGPRPFILKNLPNDYYIEGTADGIGTKGILHDAAKTHRNAAYDLLAMTASDIVRYGGLPLILINVLDIVGIGEKTQRKAYKEAMEGLGQASRESAVVILKGETAQMGVALGSEMKDSKTKLNWSGMMLGAYHKNKMITGDALKPGQVVLALRERGFRSNGISSVRAAFQKKFGKSWWQNPKAKRYLHEAAAPSVLYDKYISTLHGWHKKDFSPEIKIQAVVHLSGGGIKEKFAKDLLFPCGLSAELKNLWEPPKIMRECAKWRGIEDEEFYEVWNGGQGMLLVVDEKDAKHAIRRASDFGIQARVAGQVTKEPRPELNIFSKLTKGKIVTYRK